MENIKASEVSNLLIQQLEKFESSTKLEEVGTVLTRRWYCHSIWSRERASERDG